MSIETRRGSLTLWTWLACGFGLGFVPLAPGTVATAALAVPAGFLMPLPPLWMGLIAAMLAWSGLGLCGHAEKQLGTDAGSIVWDEFTGFAVTLIGLPGGWPTVALAFALFRLFDIAKPFPVGRSQRLRGGLGVVADDVLAGIYANAATRLVLGLIT
ncbi:phosphatidylglycerophosphatase A [Gemmatimonadota bacterium]